jgi:hypothetical protein
MSNIFTEVTPERNEEHHSEKAAHHARKENLDKGWLEFEDVKGWDGEDGSGNDDAGCLTDGLDDDVFEQGVPTSGKSSEHGGAQEDRQNCDRNRGLDHVAGFEPDVGRREGEDHDHDQTNQHRADCDLGRALVSGDYRGVCFSRLQLTKRICWQDLVGLGLAFHLYPPRAPVPSAQECNTAFDREIEPAVQAKRLGGGSISSLIN